MKDGMDLLIDPIRLWNTCLAVLAEGVPLAGGGRADVQPAPAVGALSGPTFRLETASGTILMELRQLPLGAITQSALDMAALSRLPPALAESILTRAITLMLHPLERTVQTRIRAIQPAKPDHETAGEHLILRLEGIWPDSAEVCLHADRAALSPLLLDILPVAAKGRLPEAVASRITLPCSLRLAPRDLSLKRLQGLMPGDILIPAAAKQVLHAPHAAFDISHDGTNWIIGSLDMTDPLPSAEPSTQSTEAPIPDIGEIPIRLSFVLSEHSLTVAELQNLTKGAYLPLDPAPTTPGQPVRILANGRPIGEGHVVEIDSQPAVRIARLFGV